MQSATNTRRQTVYSLALAAIVLLAFYGIVFRLEEILRVLGTTRSSSEAENLAPYQVFLFTAIASLGFGHLASMVIVRLRLPKRSHWDRRWLKHDRRQLLGRQITWVMVFTMVTTWSAAINVHLFA